MSRRGRRSSAPQNSSDGREWFDRDYGFGRTEEGRPITGVEDGEVYDPQAPIEDPKGEAITVDLAKKKPFARLCAPDQHDMKPDGAVGEDIPGAQSMKCANCPFGQYVRTK